MNQMRGIFERGGSSEIETPHSIIANHTCECRAGSTKATLLMKKACRKHEKSNLFSLGYTNVILVRAFVRRPYLVVAP